MLFCIINTTYKILQFLYRFFCTYNNPVHTFGTCSLIVDTVFSIGPVIVFKSYPVTQNSAISIKTLEKSLILNQFIIVHTFFEKPGRVNSMCVYLPTTQRKSHVTYSVLSLTKAGLNTLFYLSPIFRLYSFK